MAVAVSADGTRAISGDQVGAIRLWGVEDVWVLAAYGGESSHPTPQEALRML